MLLNVPAIRTGTGMDNRLPFFCALPPGSFGGGLICNRYTPCYVTGGAWRYGPISCEWKVNDWIMSKKDPFMGCFCCFFSVLWLWFVFVLAGTLSGHVPFSYNLWAVMCGISIWFLWSDVHGWLKRRKLKQVLLDEEKFEHE